MAKEVFKGELEALVSDGALLVDVREDEEVRATRDHPIPGTVHLPLSRLGELKGRVDREKPIIFYCRSGVRSFQAAQIAANWTEQPVYYLAGGLLSYSDA